MLKQRILSIIFILTPLILLALFVKSFVPFMLGLSVFTLFCAWEMSGLIPMIAGTTWKRVLYLLSFLVFFAAIGGMYHRYPTEVTYVTLGWGVLWWVIALGWLVIYQMRHPHPSPLPQAGEGIGPSSSYLKEVTPADPLSRLRERARVRAPYFLIGYSILVPFWFSLCLFKIWQIHDIQHVLNYWLLLPLCIVWFADSSGYFVGRWLGRHKLASRVSPGKTIEGALAGVLAGGIAVILVTSLFDLDQIKWQSFLIGMLLAIVSIVGDLFESILKRQVGAKDSGRLLPGHGGLLDRFDALTAVAPCCALIYLPLLSPVGG